MLPMHIVNLSLTIYLFIFGNWRGVMLSLCHCQLEYNMKFLYELASEK